MPSSTRTNILDRRRRHPRWAYGPTSDDSDFDEDSDLDEGTILRRQQQERGEAEVNADAYPTDTDDSETDDGSAPLWVNINGEWVDANTLSFHSYDEVEDRPDSVG
jgi:hypothetical protein